MANDLIEIAPLAYMRGRTLNDAVIILDEGQNATVPQMKMFLTRMGQNARIVVTGDTSQVDLPRRRPSAAWPTRSSGSRTSPGSGSPGSIGRTSSGIPWSRPSSTPTKKPSRTVGTGRFGAGPTKAFDDPPPELRSTRLGVRRAPAPPTGGTAGRKSRRRRRRHAPARDGPRPVDLATVKTFHELW